MTTMPALPHSVFDGAVWPAVPQTPAASLLAIQHQLEASQYLPSDELRRLQFLQIGALVQHIDRHVPFYGVSLRKAGVKPGQPITDEAWSRVPILTRRAVQEAGDRLHARALPQGHGKTSKITTSGSSGMPVSVLKSELGQFYWQAFTLREELWHRRDMTRKLMGIRRDDARESSDESVHIRRMPDWGTPISTVYPTGPAVLLDYRCTVAQQVEVLREERPDYLVTFPSVLLALLRHCRAHDVTLSGLREVKTVGEALAQETRDLCREMWGVEISDIYSTAEAGSLAFQCAEHGRYHIQSESSLVEILNDAGQECRPGETGRVVVTPLHNFAMPLIRYEIGDLAEVGDACPCGRTLPVLTNIPGRARDMLTLPSGDKRFPYYAHNAVMRVDAIVQHQVVQTSLDEIEIRLVVRRKLSDREEAQIVSAAAGGFGHPFRIRIAYRDEIKRGPGGKYAEFRSEILPTDSRD
jgi:phenylacetate-CoA ligase